MRVSIRLHGPLCSSVRRQFGGEEGLSDGFSGGEEPDDGGEVGPAPKTGAQPAPTRGFSWYFESVACRCPWYFASPFELYGRSARSVV